MSVITSLTFAVDRRIIIQNRDEELDEVEEEEEAETMEGSGGAD
jgi:hypothetical protein